MPSEKRSHKKSIPTTVSTFAILPLTLPSAEVPAEVADTKHFVYIRPHEPNNPTPTADRSLFLSNVPIDANTSNIRVLFAEQLGGSRVETVNFDSSIPSTPVLKRWKAGTDLATKSKKRKRDEEIVAEGVIENEESKLPETWLGELRRSGGCAVVVFVDRSSAKGAWKEVQKSVKEGREIHWVQGDNLGLERYKSHHTLRYPPASALQTSINAYLSQFNRAETARDRIRKKQRSVPDEDGFITVSRGGRSGPARLEQAEAKQKELEERRKKNSVKDDFYRFQTREKRKEAETELRRKFEADRRRVAEMRERRGKSRPET